MAYVATPSRPSIATAPVTQSINPRSTGALYPTHQVLQHSQANKLIADENFEVHSESLVAIMAHDGSNTSTQRQSLAPERKASVAEKRMSIYYGALRVPSARPKVPVSALKVRNSVIRPSQGITPAKRLSYATPARNTVRVAVKAQKTTPPPDPAPKRLTFAAPVTQVEHPQPTSPSTVSIVSDQESAGRASLTRSAPIAPTRIEAPSALPMPQPAPTAVAAVPTTKDALFKAMKANREQRRELLARLEAIDSQWSSLQELLLKFDA